MFLLGRSGGWRTPGEKLFKELLFSKTESVTIKNNVYTTCEVYANLFGICTRNPVIFFLTGLLFLILQVKLFLLEKLIIWSEKIKEKVSHSQRENMKT